MTKKKCKKCKHEWLVRVDDPIECPNCKTRDWKASKEKQKEVV